MDALTAYSTLALAVLTLALVILAAVNFQKFIENVSLVAQGLEKQANSINLQAQSLKAQAESIDLQSKDILLNYKPVVFIKEVVLLANAQDTSDPYKYAFVLTNSGKLPARNVEVSVTANSASGTNSDLGLIHTIIDKASIYPGADLIFHVPRMIIRGDKIDKAQFQFRIRYMGDGLPQQMHENMKYIFSDQTNRRWIYTGPKVDIFFKEKFDRKKSQYTDLADVEISEGRLSIIKQIVDGIVGTDKVLKSNANELITLFTTVSKEIREMKHFRTYGLNEGALTGLRGPVRIIDENDQLTLIGVSVFKCVGEVLGSEEMESDQ